MKINLLLLLSIPFLFSSCKKDDDPIGPDNNPYSAVFTEQFDEESDWEYFEEKFDSTSQTSEYVSKTFYFINGIAELEAVQNDDCERVALTKPLGNSQEIIDIIEDDTLFITFNVNEVEYSALGWSAIAIAVGNHVLEFSFKQINEPTEFALKITNWQMFDLTMVGDTEADLAFEYSNNPEVLGTNKIIVKADACGADLYASAKLVLDKIVMVKESE
jgi:hypothetical protein